jgi:hypothetical protein
VKGGDKLDLGGGHVMEFVMAPNLHWPDTMFSFDHGTGGLEGFGREGGRLKNVSVFGARGGGGSRQWRWFLCGSAMASKPHWPNTIP